MLAAILNGYINISLISTECSMVKICKKETPSWNDLAGIETTAPEMKEENT